VQDLLQCSLVGKQKLQLLYKSLAPSNNTKNEGLTPNSRVAKRSQSNIKLETASVGM
jgi:hypothetical protein